jgi:hypothetical protein
MDERRNSRDWMKNEDASIKWTNKGWKRSWKNQVNEWGKKMKLRRASEGMRGERERMRGEREVMKGEIWMLRVENKGIAAEIEVIWEETEEMRIRKEGT